MRSASASVYALQMVINCAKFLTLLWYTALRRCALGHLQQELLAYAQAGEGRRIEEQDEPLLRVRLDRHFVELPVHRQHGRSHRPLGRITHRDFFWDERAHAQEDDLALLIPHVRGRWCGRRWAKRCTVGWLGGVTRRADERCHPPQHRHSDDQEHAIPGMHRRPPSLMAWGLVGSSVRPWALLLEARHCTEDRLQQAVLLRRLPRSQDDGHQRDLLHQRRHDNRGEI